MQFGAVSEGGQRVAVCMDVFVSWCHVRVCSCFCGCTLN